MCLSHRINKHGFICESVVELGGTKVVKNEHMNSRDVKMSQLLTYRARVKVFVKVCGVDYMINQ